MSQPEPLSLTSVHLEMFFNGQPLGVNGSGFVIQTRAGPMLVTAMHNLTGREIDGKCKHTLGALPNTVTLKNYFGLLSKDVPLFQGDNDPNHATQRFFTHASRTVDVALLPLPPTVCQHAANILDPSLWRPLRYAAGIPVVRPGDECYAIGYPEGLTNNLGSDSVLPVWKVGHIANDAQFAFNGEDLCLIDASTRPGVSGAPVFIVRRSWDDAISHCRLVGVYSGRTSDTSQLGRVWKPTIIHEILQAQFAETW